LEAANLLLDVAVFGASVPKLAQTVQAAESGDAGSAFGELVAKLLEQSGIKTGVEEVRAGQQSQGQQKDDDKSGDTKVDAEVIAQAQCLLGSMETVQDVPETAVLKYESVPSTVDIASVRTATVSASPNGEVPETIKMMPSEGDGVETVSAKIIPAVPEESGSTKLDTQSQETVEAQTKSQPAVALELSSTSTEVEKPKATQPERPSQVQKNEDVQLPVKAAQQVQAQEKPVQVIPGDPVPTVRPTEQSASDVVKSALVGELEAGLTSDNGSTEVSDGGNRVISDRHVSAPLSQTRSKYATLFGINLPQSNQTVQTVNPAGSTSDLRLGTELMRDRVFDLPQMKPEEKAVVADQQPSWMQTSAPVIPGLRAVEAVQKSQGQLPPSEQLGAKMIHQIVKAAKVNLTEVGGNMTLRLDPPHLGTVHMNVSVVEGAVTASIQTTTESARQVLQADLAILKETLAGSGIHVDSINVSVGSDQNQAWHSHSGGHGSPTEGKSHNGGWHQHGPQGSSEVAPEPSMAMASAYGSGLNFLA
jgi:flagellar hook-length control protein FliK